MKKRAVLSLLIITLFLISLAYAEENETVTDDIGRAYQCLEGKLETNCGNSDSTEQLSFSLLAMGYKSSVHSDCRQKLLDEQRNDGSWDSNLKQTAIAVLALDNVNKNTEDAEEWLLDQKETADDLEWYLQIDSSEETDCKINGKTTTLREDKTLSKSAGTCLSLGYEDYWLKIKTSCFDENFTISCDKDFITTLIYREKTTSEDSPYYVSSETHSASADESTEERVNAFCLEESGDCDYEGTLWAAFALKKTGNDIREFLPYLITLKDRNEKYMPSAFLYILTDYDEYFTELISQQKSDTYWEESGKKYYDTALALLALYGKDSDEAEATKEYLLEKQDSSGCWDNGNIKHTAFLLYAGWPKTPIAVGGGTSDNDCSDFGNYCTSFSDCSGDNILENFYCPSSRTCCKVAATEESCYEKEGIVCSSSQECTGDTVLSSDGTCCLDSCRSTDEQWECEQYDYTCKSTCSSGEEEKVYDCDSEKVCCADESSGGGSYWWLWLLIILIILLVLAIVFRNQLKIWFFRIKSKFRKGPVSTQGRPPFPPAPSGTPQRMGPRQLIPRRSGYPRPQRPMPRQNSGIRKELDETLKKLKEMSK